METHPESRGLLELLDHGFSLKTPAFQRSYAWEKSNVRDFWKDIVRAVDLSGETPAECFLGLVVLDMKSEIQDGQQRLATTLLFASQIYELIEQVKRDYAEYDEELALNAVAEVSPALRTGSSAPLTIGLADQEELMGRAGISSSLPESRKRLRAARKTLRAHLEVDLAPRTSADAKLSRLNQLARFLREGAYVVVLRVPHRDAHNIFETLNTRGVLLSRGDLVKSHLIATATDTGRAISKWNDVVGALRNSSGEYVRDLESFLLHYYGSRYGETTTAELFTDFRQKVESQDPLAVLDELVGSAKIYRALVDPREQGAFWTRIGVGTQEAVELLNGLGLKQVRYVLLAVLRDFAKDKLANARHKTQRDAIVKIAAWSVRALVHRRLGGGEAMKTFIAAAAAIRNERSPAATVMDLRKVFEDRNVLMSDDNLFERRFQEYRFDNRTNHTKARAVLCALEYTKSGAQAGMRPREGLSVEHVLPQSPADGQWTHFSDDEKRDYTYLLGNLLLVDYPSGANNSLGNKKWPQKRTLLVSWEGQTPLTIDALKHTNWTRQTIDHRQLELARLAVKTWPV